MNAARVAGGFGHSHSQLEEALPHGYILMRETDWHQTTVNKYVLCTATVVSFYT